MSKTPRHTSENESIARRHETTDANFRNLMMTAAGLLGLMVFGLVISWIVLSVAKDHTSAPGNPTETFTRAEQGALPPGPNLQPDPHGVLIALRQREDSVLAGYAWVNKDSGIARIPIDRAMALLAKKGLPVHKPKGGRK